MENLRKQMRKIVGKPRKKPTLNASWGKLGMKLATSSRIDQKPFKCPHCSDGFAQECYRANHIKWKHAACQNGNPQPLEPPRANQGQELPPELLLPKTPVVARMDGHRQRKLAAKGERTRIPRSRWPELIEEWETGGFCDPEEFTNKYGVKHPKQRVSQWRSSLNQENSSDSD